MTMEWDFFIAYATEDRDTVATPLAEALRARGFQVWYDVFNLDIGKPLLQSIDEGLRASRFGIVVLSANFFAKHWPLNELAGLYNRSVHENRPVILPIWFKLRASDVAAYSPLLSNLVSVPWEAGINTVIERILSAAGYKDAESLENEYSRVYSTIYNLVTGSNYDSVEVEKRYYSANREKVKDALRSIALNRDIRHESRIRALQSLIAIGRVDSDLLTEIVTEPNETLIRDIYPLLTDSNITLTKEQVALLFANPRLPHSSSGLGRMIKAFINRGAGYTSEVLLPSATYPSWEVEYDCLQTIIEIDDRDSLETLSKFPMKYWIGRKKVVGYIRSLIEKGSVTEHKPLMEQIVSYIISKTEPRTPTMRQAKEVLALLQGENAVTQPIATRLSLLFVTSDPSDQSRLRLGEEAREIQEKIRLSKSRDRFEFHIVASARPEDITQALLDIEPQIVHFSGHGTSRGDLCFEGQNGESLPVCPDALASLFAQFSGSLTCVLLNACYSEIQAEAISKNINYVIGMNKSIGDKAAIAFSVGFYQGLGAGRVIEDAYALGCIQIRLLGIPEHLTPVLIRKKD